MSNTGECLQDLQSLKSTLEKMVPRNSQLPRTSLQFSNVFFDDLFFFTSMTPDRCTAFNERTPITTNTRPRWVVSNTQKVSKPKVRKGIQTHWTSSFYTGLSFKGFHLTRLYKTDKNYHHHYRCKN